MNAFSMETLTHVLGNMLGMDIADADYQDVRLHGGTLGDVRLITGTARTADGAQMPYRVVLKIQKRWERHGDPGSWRREYDLYASDLYAFFTDDLRWPNCYHAELCGDETRIWMAYAEGVSGLALTGDMYERAAEALGRLQGRLYAQRPAALTRIGNLSEVAFMKNHYLHYRSWPEVYDYIRADGCALPEHLREMLIAIDADADAVLRRVERLPIVLCHRDFWVANIIHTDGGIVLIDWDTAGWGYLGEDIASLIADEADVRHMAEYYRRCVPAYYRGFAEHVDVSHITDDCVWELMVLMFGYRLVEWYKFAESEEEKALHRDTLQQIYEMRR